MAKIKKNIKPKPVSLMTVILVEVITFIIIMTELWLSISKDNYTGNSFMVTILLIIGAQVAIQYRFIDPLVRETERLNKEIKELKKR